MYINPLDDRNKSVASSGKLSTVDNSESTNGKCPKCKDTFGTGVTPVGTVYYCSQCRVALPIIEE